MHIVVLYIWYLVSVEAESVYIVVSRGGMLTVLASVLGLIERLLLFSIVQEAVPLGML